MPGTHTKTLGQLIGMLVDRECLEARSKQAHSKITEAPAMHNLSGFYAIRGCEYQSEAMDVTRRINEIVGYDRLRVICEAEGERTDATKVRQLRGQWCLAKEVEISVADAMTVEEFAREITRLKKGELEPPAPPTAETGLLRINAWTELSIGIDVDGFWALPKSLAVGDVFPKSEAHKLDIGGKQLPAVLKAFANALDPPQERRETLISALDLLAPPSPSLTGSRIGRKAAQSAIHEELPSRGSASARRLTRVLADLRRKLKRQVTGPKGRKGGCLSVGGEYVRSGFIVRFLFKRADGSLSFGERPHR